MERISSWFENYSDDIYHYLVYYTGRKDVDDLVQEVFIKAMKGIDGFKGSSSPKTWLISIARNTAITEIRKQKVLRFLPFAEGIEIKDERNINPEIISEEKETYSSLLRAISKLRKPYRDVILLRKISELNAEETAAILGWKVEKVNLTLHRALKALEKELSTKNGGDHLEESLG